MVENIIVPDWLQSMIQQVVDGEDWPNGEYPAVAMEARDRIGEYGGDEDWQASLLQLVIGEVMRLQGRLAEREELANILRDANGEIQYRPSSYDTLQAEVKRLRAKDASLFQAEPHTEDKTDKWLILALRILIYIERDDVAEGLEAEVERLRVKLKECGIEEGGLDGNGNG